MSFSFWVGVKVTRVPLELSLPSRKATYCSRVILGGVTTRKSERRRKGERREGKGRGEEKEKEKEKKKKEREEKKEESHR